MTLLRTAKQWGTTPLAMLGVADPGRWYEEDRLLAAAFELFEATRIDHLGLPKRDTEEGDAEGWWEVGYRLNAAQQALDLAKKSEEAKSLEAGTIPYLVDTREDATQSSLIPTPLSLA